MSTIHVFGTTRAVPGSPVRSVLVSLQREGIPIETICGGRAMCGRCAVGIVSGAEFLNSPGSRERERLGQMSAAPDIRLACQLFAQGDVTVRILNPGPARNHERARRRAKPGQP